MSEIKNFNDLIFDNVPIAIYYKERANLADGVFYQKQNEATIYITNGKCHRADGPAFENKWDIKDYYYHGQLISAKNDEEFYRQIKLLCLK